MGADDETEAAAQVDPVESSDAVGVGSAADDFSSEESASAEKPPKKKRPFWRELPFLIVVALILALVIKAFIVQAFYIPSASMENTLEVGDRVLVNKIVYHVRPIERGDVIVFNGDGSWDPEANSGSSNPFTAVWHSIEGLVGVEPGQTDYVKRVIGLPGDHVACVGPGHPITVNGHPLAESAYLYRNPQTGQLDQPSEMPFKVVVPPGEVWVMGDHREVSFDSRGHIGDPGGGAIPESSVIGRAFVIVWPPSHIGTIPIPASFTHSGLAAAGAPAVPLAAGLVGALPLTLLHRRLRLRALRQRALQQPGGERGGRRAA